MPEPKSPETKPCRRCRREVLVDPTVVRCPVCGTPVEPPAGRKVEPDPARPSDPNRPVRGADRMVRGGGVAAPKE